MIGDICAVDDQVNDNCTVDGCHGDDEGNHNCVVCHKCYKLQKGYDNDRGIDGNAL